MEKIKVTKTKKGSFRFFAALGTKCVVCNKPTKNCCFSCRVPLCTDCEDKELHECEKIKIPPAL